jgi:hypothetical protein
VPPLAWILLVNRRSHRTLATAASHQFATLEPNRCREKLGDIKGKLPMVLVKLESRRSSPVPSLKIEASRPPSRATLRSPSPPENHPRWVPISHRTCRWRPHREGSLLPLGCLTGEGTKATSIWCIVPPPSPVGVIVSRMSLDQRPRLEAGYPFGLIKSEPQIKESMTRVESMDLWAGAVDSVHQTVDLFLQFFNRKINPKNLKNRRTHEILRKHHQTFLKLYFSPI